MTLSCRAAGKEGGDAEGRNTPAQSVEHFWVETLGDPLDN